MSAPQQAQDRAPAGAEGVAQAPASPAGVGTMIAALKAKTQQAPNDPEAWQNLGWAYMHINPPDAAACL